MSHILCHKFGHLDEDVSHSRLAVAWVSLAGHDTNGLAIDLVVVEILQTLDSCIAVSASEAPVLDDKHAAQALPSAVDW